MQPPHIPDVHLASKLDGLYAQGITCVRAVVNMQYSGTGCNGELLLLPKSQSHVDRSDLRV
jgi:hypothetical protein